MGVRSSRVVARRYMLYHLCVVSFSASAGQCPKAMHHERLTDTLAVIMLHDEMDGALSALTGHSVGFTSFVCLAPIAYPVVVTPRCGTGMNAVGTSCQKASNPRRDEIV
jgi:hypothetical protein